LHRLFLPDFHLLQLAQMINEKPQTINEYEAGKAIPNPQVGEGRQQAACGRGCCLGGDTLVPTVCFCGLLACSRRTGWLPASLRC
jgi:type IV secretory pathway TrbF-like protein